LKESTECPITGETIYPVPLKEKKTTMICDKYDQVLKRCSIKKRKACEKCGLRYFLDDQKS